MLHTFRTLVFALLVTGQIAHATLLDDPDFGQEFGQVVDALAVLDPTDTYYTVNDRVTISSTSSFEPFTGIQTYFSRNAGSTFSLLKWVRHTKPLATSPKPYNRSEHFKSWIYPDRSVSCLNVRSQVLVRDSSGPVKYKANNPCSVESGIWEDPYSDQVITTSDAIQIDHFVPLKNAFESGAWKWSKSKRCMYSNYMANDYHLLAVDGHENMSKGHKGPDGYLPPNRAFVCEYLKRWLKVKMIWKLAMPRDEAIGVEQAIAAYGCDTAMLKISQSELAKQRTESNDVLPSCN